MSGLETRDRSQGDAPTEEVDQDGDRAESQRPTKGTPLKTHRRGDLVGGKGPKEKGRSHIQTRDEYLNLSTLGESTLPLQGRGNVWTLPQALGGLGDKKSPSSPTVYDSLFSNRDRTSSQPLYRKHREQSGDFGSPVFGIRRKGTVPERVQVPTTPLPTRATFGAHRSSATTLSGSGSERVHRRSIVVVK